MAKSARIRKRIDDMGFFLRMTISPEKMATNDSRMKKKASMFTLANALNV